MKRCIIMLTFFIIILILSALVENSDKAFLENSVVVDESNVEMASNSKALRNRD